MTAVKKYERVLEKKNEKNQAMILQVWSQYGKATYHHNSQNENIGCLSPGLRNQQISTHSIEHI
jgi:hypothetical protein